jgi:hypothetical protein
MATLPDTRQDSDVRIRTTAHWPDRLLRREGTELILLFEDLALFGLVDDDLYDQFSQPPRDDYCPLRVVFAITTAKYLELRDTVRDRVTHRYDVQNMESGDGDADPAMVTFVARYLNNARPRPWLSGALPASARSSDRSLPIRDRNQ